jgi:hypothetical protein
MTKQFRPRGIESDGLMYYQEQDKAGDYVSIDPTTNEYYLKNFHRDVFEGRATAIHGNVTSVCTTGISRTWLKKKCHRVAKDSIPAKWLEVL